LRPWKIRLHDLALRPGPTRRHPHHCNYHHTASRISLEIPNGWRVAGAIAPTQPSPAKTGLSHGHRLPPHSRSGLRWQGLLSDGTRSKKQLVPR